MTKIQQAAKRLIDAAGPMIRPSSGDMFEIKIEGLRNIEVASVK